MMTTENPLVDHPMAFFQTCRATDGLDRFPESERFSVWRSAHKSLVRKDTEYRRFRNIHFGITVLFLIPICLGNAFSSWIADTVPVPYGFHEFIAIPCFVALAAVALAVYVGWCFTLQSYMNRRVAEELRSPDRECPPTMHGRRAESPSA
jgi:hypothetical protein